MLGKGPRRARDGPRRPRTSGATRDLYFVAVASILLAILPSPLSQAAPPYTWSPSAATQLTGCASGNARMPHWDPVNSTARLRTTAAARICAASHGGGAFGSSSTTSASLTVIAPLALSGGPGGVNVSWRFTAGLSTSGSVGGSTSCPIHRSTAQYNFGYTWYNYTQTYATCYALGSASFGGYAFVRDLSTGREFPASNGWNGLFNVSGAEVDSFAYSATYSNASYWGYNASGSFSLNYSYGPRGALSGTWRPTWFINGSFSAADAYEVETTISSTTQALAYGYANCSASSAVDLASGARSGLWSATVVW